MEARATTLRKTMPDGTIQRMPGFIPILDLEELNNAHDDNMGFCLACGTEAGGCEPDARAYECESCGVRMVYGIPELAIMGLLKVTDGED